MHLLPLVLVGALVALASGILLLASRRPDRFATARSVRILAPAHRIFPLLEDLRAHEAWSTFDPPDPRVRKFHSGAPCGVGAVYDWDGGRRRGAGRLSITASVPGSSLDMRLDMLRPVKVSHRVQFTLQPEGGTTLVTWRMEGRTPLPGKIMQLFMDMERIVGDEFETSLRRLGALAAATP